MLYSAIDLLSAMDRTLDGSAAGQRRRRFYDETGATVTRSDRAPAPAGSRHLTQRISRGMAAMVSSRAGLLPRSRQAALPEPGCCEAAPC